MSARTDLAAHLSEVLPDDFDVLAADEDLVLSRRTVIVTTERIDPESGTFMRKYTLSALVLSPKQTVVDDDLDAALEEVLEAIDLWDQPTVWTAAERVVYRDRYQSFKVTTELHVQRTYPPKEG